MEDQKVPEIDRTSKPSIATKENRITNVNNNIKRSSMNLKDREDRMEPVYRGERVSIPMIHIHLQIFFTKIIF